jgi:hypothetical protein
LFFTLKGVLMLIKTQRCKVCGKKLEGIELGQEMCEDCYARRGPAEQYGHKWAVELDTIAGELEPQDPRLALALDRISDSLEANWMMIERDLREAKIAIKNLKGWTKDLKEKDIKARIESITESLERCIDSAAKENLKNDRFGRSAATGDPLSWPRTKPVFKSDPSISLEPDEHLIFWITSSLPTADNEYWRKNRESICATRESLIKWLKAEGRDRYTFNYEPRQKGHLIEIARMMEKDKSYADKVFRMVTEANKKHYEEMERIRKKYHPEEFKQDFFVEPCSPVKGRGKGCQS